MMSCRVSLTVMTSGSIIPSRIGYSASFEDRVRFRRRSALELRPPRAGLGLGEAGQREALVRRPLAEHPAGCLLAEGGAELEAVAGAAAAQPAVGGPGLAAGEGAARPGGRAR